MRTNRSIYIMSTKALADPEVFAKGYASLSKGRQEKIDRIKPKEEKRLSLAAGLLLDQGLKNYGLRERDLFTEKGPHGKPHFPDHPKIHFSLSHSGYLAMAVFSDTETGCDIQQIKDPKEALAKRFFCPQERDWIEEAAWEPERTIRFYRLWVLKESFLKATGEGMHLSMDSFCFTMGAKVTVSQSYDEAKYDFEEFSFGGYRAALCLKSEE